MPAIKKHSARGSVSRLREMIGSSGSPLFTCSLTKRPVPMRPHGRSEVDADGSILLFIDRNMIDPGDGTHAAQLFYANGSDMEYLSISGTGEQVTDSAMIRRQHEMHGSDEGIRPDDLLIRIRPESAFSWNTRTGALTPIMKK